MLRTTTMPSCWMKGRTFPVDQTHVSWSAKKHSCWRGGRCSCWTKGYVFLSGEVTSLSAKKKSPAQQKVMPHDWAREVAVWASKQLSLSPTTQYGLSPAVQQYKFSSSVRVYRRPSNRQGASNSSLEVLRFSDVSGELVLGTPKPWKHCLTPWSGYCIFRVTNFCLHRLNLTKYWLNMSKTIRCMSTISRNVIFSK